MTVEQFQAAHGPSWAEITKHPAFFAAMQVVSADKLQRIATITDEEIQQHGAAILADFRGHLAHENKLIELAVTAPELGAFDLPPETYRDTSQDVQPTPEQPENREFISFQSPVIRKRKPKKKAK